MERAPDGRALSPLPLFTSPLRLCLPGAFGSSNGHDNASRSLAPRITCLPIVESATTGRLLRASGVPLRKVLGHGPVLEPNAEVAFVLPAKLMANLVQRA